MDQRRCVCARAARRGVARREAGSLGRGGATPCSRLIFAETMARWMCMSKSVPPPRPSPCSIACTRCTQGGSRSNLVRRMLVTGRAFSGEANSRCTAPVRSAQRRHHTAQGRSSGCQGRKAWPLRSSCPRDLLRCACSATQAALVGSRRSRSERVQLEIGACGRGRRAKKLAVIRLRL